MNSDIPVDEGFELLLYLFARRTLTVCMGGVVVVALGVTPVDGGHIIYRIALNIGFLISQNILSGLLTSQFIHQTT